MAHLIPHTTEWFKALEAVDRRQADTTRQIIQMAGGSDVCSICGDSPAKDYRIIGVKFQANIDATMRLCDECRELRHNMHGESFAPLST